MNLNILKRVYGWDYRNWSKSVIFWRKHLPNRKLRCLEVGANEGGLSLLLALYDYDVLCTDLTSPETKAKPLHDAIAHPGTISYQGVDIRDLPFNEEFDLIVLKSVIGGVARNGDEELANLIAKQLYKALKPGGKVLFAENSAGSVIHRTARGLFKKWGHSWSYFTPDQFAQIFSSFSKVEIKTFGFFGAFAIGRRSEFILSLADQYLDPVIPSKAKYILFGFAEKNI